MNISRELDAIWMKIHDDELANSPQNRLEATRHISSLFSEKGYVFDYNEGSGDFEIQINELSRITGTLTTACNADYWAIYSIRMHFGSESKDFRNVDPLAMEEFLPVLDKIIAESNELYKKLQQESKDTKQAEVFEALLRQHLLLLGDNEHKYSFKQITNDGNTSMIMYSPVMSGLVLATNLNQDNYGERIARLVNVMKTVPNTLSQDREFKVIGQYMGNRNVDFLLDTNGLKKNFDRKGNRKFTDAPYSAKYDRTPKSKKLVSFLKKKGIEYGYNESGLFVIQYAPNGDDYGVVTWNEFDGSYSDLHYQISKKGVLKRRSKDFSKGMIEMLTEDEVILILTLALENNAFAAETDTKILRHSLISAMAQNRLDAGVKVSRFYEGAWRWSGVGFGPELLVYIPEIKVTLLFQWKSLKHFLSECALMDEIMPIVNDLRQIGAQDNDVNLIS